MPTKPQLAVGIDAGSWRTRCVISLVEDGYLRFLGAGSVPSSGWHKGRINDAQEVSANVARAVREAETNAQVLVESAVIGVGGPSVEGEEALGIYEFGRPRAIGPDDLAYAVNRSAMGRMGDDRLLLHVLAQDFILDGQAGFRYPVGDRCSRLEANVLLVTCSLREHQALVSAVQKAHIAVEETVFEPVASAYAATVAEQREGGLAVIDMGVHSTGLAVYDGESIRGAASLPICADHLTRDLTLGLRAAYGVAISYEDAEMLKREYGCAMRGLTAENTLIEIPSADRRNSREITRKQMNEILESRAEELFLFVKRELRKCGMEQSLMEGVFLTGGGARLNGMCDMAERVLSCHAQYGLAIGIEGWPPNFDDPAWTTVAGLSMYAARLKMRKSARRKAPGPLALLGVKRD
jgi:cell division protein FtsA